MGYLNMANGLVNGDRAARAAMWEGFARLNKERAASALVNPGGSLGFKISKDCEKAARDNLEFASLYR